jgi:hypothetical protein
MTPARAVTDFLDGCDEHLGGEGESHVTIVLGHRVVGLHSCCADTQEAVVSHFGHLTTDSVAEAHLTIVETDHVGSVCPAIGWRWDSPHHDDATGSARFIDYTSTVVAWEEDATRVVVATRGFGATDLAFRENVRLLLQPALSLLGIETLHGGSLGTTDRGILLIGRGGSGKSTLVSAGVHAGWSTLGDDFVLMPTGANAETMRLSSLFSTAKLEPSSPASKHYPGSNNLRDGKRVVELSRHPDSVVARQSIVGIAAVSVGPESSLRDATPHTVLDALLPYSVVLTDTPTRLTATVTHHLERVPAFHLTSGPHLHHTLSLLARVVGR